MLFLNLISIKLILSPRFLHKRFLRKHKMDVFTNIDKSDNNGKPRAIEDIYVKKSQLEHILLRPDACIGSVEYTDPADFNELKLNNDLSELIEIFQTNKVVATGEEEIEIGLEANRLSTFDLPVVEHENDELAEKEKIIRDQKLLINRYEDELSRERVDRIRLEDKMKILSDENEKRLQEAMLLNQELVGQLRECERLREASFAAMIKELKRALNKCNELESEKLALILKYQEI
uniref:Uncharacterized protein n=1 Tax=Acrobeloides nanus TaxID=290746 RepID=A0A914DZ42_9BILA